MYEEGTGDNLSSVSVAADRTGSFSFFSFSASSSWRSSALRSARILGSADKKSTALLVPFRLLPSPIAVTHDSKKTFNRFSSRTRRDSSQPSGR